MEEPDPTHDRFSAPASGAGGAGPFSASAGHPLPSGDFSFEVHFDVLRRFMTASRNGAEPVEPAAAEGHGVPARAAQANAAFLSDIGLLIEEMPGRFKPTPVAMQLINTQIADEGRGRRLLRSVIEKTWFGAVAKRVLQDKGAGSSREQSLTAALTAAVGALSGQDASALRVLEGYLVYTGIMTRPGTGVLQETGLSAPATQAPPPILPPLPTNLSRRRPPVSPGPAPQPLAKEEGWESIETSEFSVKIRPKAAAIRRLRKQLDLLDQKLREHP